ncbi:Lysine-specific histone demethylase 1-like protein 2 [Hibiscus syriacus]|uniref:Lysine-specific histone demethylase 1-like protein 2 n=1 Tax=Hibiscus syriacus TaxID=106335 RepID=A0A6A3ADW4_HIBSY|nr:Lysine-specific histone demethylase 1-like protein 2 [Hibiscus syriacus]
MDGFANHISLGSVLGKVRQLYTVARSPEERQLLEWHLANLEYANSGCLSDLLAAYWDQDNPYEMGGDHCFLSGGNWRLVKALSDGVPIIYGKRVYAIKYGVEGVEVVAGNQAFQADMVLCTVPLGVLKRKTIRFEPELPQRKLAAINRLGFGLLNKVAMIFPHVFWGEELDTFRCLNETSDNRGEFFLFYSYHTVSGGPVLIALVAGEAARTFEHTDPSLADYDILAESIGNRLFFAGEATTLQYPATMHGAYLSGLRDASRILCATRGHQNYFRRFAQRNFGPNNDHLASLLKWPDLVCGKFSFVFNPLTEDPKSLGLLRITFDNCKDDMRNVLEKSCDPLSNQPLQLHTTLSHEQAHELQMVTGEEESKWVYLIKNIGSKLMGANAVGITYNTLVTSISNARRGRGGRCHISAPLLNSSAPLVERI